MCQQLAERVKGIDNRHATVLVFTYYVGTFCNFSLSIV